MVAMNKWQDITDTEICQGAKWSTSVTKTYMLEPPCRDIRLAVELLQVRVLYYSKLRHSSRIEANFLCMQRMWKVSARE